MRIKLKRLAMTAMLLSSTSMSFADDGLSASVGDLAGFGEDAYFEGAEQYIGDDEEGVGQTEPYHDPLEADQLQPKNTRAGDYRRVVA